MFIEAHVGINCNIQINHFSNIYKFVVMNIIFMVSILELYFRFRVLSLCSCRDVILHPPAKFCSNQTIGGGVMTSYQFFRMAAIKSEIYFRVQVSSLHAQ